MKKISKNQYNNNILKIGSKNLNTENWKVYHPTGRHMFTCGEKKAKWYLERNLAIKVGNKKIKFTFDPKGNGFSDDEEFGRTARETRCVVSGLTDGLQRHHIVPYCYRTYFPEKYKSKNHHDVVLINHEKHSEYEKLANLFKDKIAHIYGVKTITEYNLEYTANLREIGKKYVIILNSIHSILKGYNKLPQNIIHQKLLFISDEIGISFNEFSKYNYIQLYKLYLIIKDIHYAETYKFKVDERKFYDHGYHVVKQLDCEEKIMEFVKLWRQHFIETMKPKYMPKGWSIDFRIKTKL